MKWHPAAEIFEMLPDGELQSLADSIRENGLQEAIKTLGGNVIDGRNRLVACRLAGVEPRFEEVQLVGSAAAYAFAANFHRRHLNDGGRAMAAAKYKEIAAVEAAERKKMTEGRPAKGDKKPVENLPPVSGKARDVAGEKFGISGKTVDAAERVLKKGTPELQEAVKAGNVSVSKAAKIAELPKPQQAKAIQTGIPKPVQRYPDSDLFAQWLETIRMRTDGILQQFGSFKALLDRPGWDHNEDGTLHPILAGLQITLTKFEEEFAQWRNAHGK